MVQSSEAGATRTTSVTVRAASDGLPTCLTGGDDYELLLAVPPAQVGALRAEGARVGVALTRVGRFVAEPGVRVLDGGGEAMSLPVGGWSHFR